MPPSCAKLFRAIGIDDAIDRAPFVRSTGNTVWWGGGAARIEPFADAGRGWQLEVVDLAALIRRRASAAGAVIQDSGSPNSPDLILDCGGRFSPTARAHDVRRPLRDHRTIALVGEWHHDTPWPVPDDTHTIIESYADGWMWSVPLGSGVRHVAAMVDPHHSDLERGRAATEVYLAEVGKTTEFRRLTAAARLVGGPWGWDASEYDATHYAADNWMLVGDAGSFVDPLSSAGVKKALASGWLAAIVAHTCLKSPSMKPHALAFFNAREREIAAHLHRESARFLADAAAGHPRPFWEERQLEEATDAVDEAGIREAFDRLKRARAVRLRIGPTIAIEARPIIRGNELVLEPHIVGPGDRAPVRYVSGVDVVALLELAPLAGQVPDLHAAYENRLGRTPLPGFLHALATALARGWLVSQ